MPVRRIPSYREQLRRSPAFAETELLVKKFARTVNRYYSEGVCFRTLTSSNYEYELMKWEELGGFDPRKSMWKRFVCTANPFLPRLMGWGFGEQSYLGFSGLLGEPVLTMEVKPPSLKCARYSDLALGKHPVIKGVAAKDLYVAQDDLLLAECWSDQFVPLSAVRRIYLNPSAPESAKEKVRDFARRYGIPVVEELPEPGAPGWESQISLEELLMLKRYLCERSMKSCPARINTENDAVAAALAESYDEELFNEAPLGASDAIYQRNVRKRRKIKQVVRSPLYLDFAVKTGEYPPESCDQP